MFKLPVDRWGFVLAILLCPICLATSARAQTNLLLNPNANDGALHWQVTGQSTVEEFDGDKVFVVRKGSSVDAGFGQDVNVVGSDVGKFALLIGRGSSERINPDGAITGLPYLYGYMMDLNGRRGGIINTHMQGQEMLARPSKKDEWVTMFGVFPVVKGTVAIRFFLQQAERKGLPQNSSAARFDNVGLFLFDTERAALEFARSYQ